MKSKIKRNLVDIDNVRVHDQKLLMKKIIANGDCPFCLENIGKYHNKDILKMGRYWYLTYNKWPYENTKVHLLAIYKEHAEDLIDLSPKSGNELIELMKWAQSHFNVKGGGFAMRFGDTDLSAGTVNHLHAQFIEPDINSNDYQPVRIKIGKNKDKLKK